jgi:thiamine biosynthesis protein ThiS
MKLMVNGKEMEFKDGAPVSELIGALGLSDRRVAVELNRAIIHRDAYKDTVLKDGDALEILSFVGGG